MATSFPTSLDSLTNPSSTSDTATLSHASQHANANDAIEALETKVGIDSSAVTTSLDYKLTNASSSNPGHKHTLTNGATDVTSSAAELNVLDGIPATLTATEISYVDGVTSAIQTQLDAKVRTATKVVAPSGVTTEADYYCDGTDDNVQIQAAIDAVEALGGGTVYIRRGTYVLGTTVSVDTAAVNIVGEGVGATILQAKIAFPTDSGLLNLEFGQSSASNLTVDGNKANQTTQNHWGIGIDIGYQGRQDILVQDVEVKNTNRNAGTSAGIYIGDAASPKIFNAYLHDNEGYGLYDESGIYLVADSVHSVANTLEGFQLTGSGYGRISNCLALSNTLDGFEVNSSVPYFFINCMARSNSQRGFSLVEAYSQMHNCLSYQNSTYGVYVQGTKCIINGCSIRDNTQNGIRTDADETVITSNIVEENAKHGIELNAASNCVVSENLVNQGDGLDADNTYSGILITGTSVRNSITGNRILGDGATNDYAYCIREAASADDRNVIANNIAGGADTAQISSQGANSDVSHNITS